MKVAIVFSEGTKQINFTPESEDEKQALKLFRPDNNIQLAVKTGSFGDKHMKPFTIGINHCMGGFLRAYDNAESIMLVLTPRAENVTDDERDFIKNALNFYWNDAHTNLQRKDLGDIERQNYQYQLDKSKQILDKL